MAESAFSSSACSSRQGAVLQNACYPGKQCAHAQRAENSTGKDSKTAMSAGTAILYRESYPVVDTNNSITSFH